MSELLLGVAYPFIQRAITVNLLRGLQVFLVQNQCSSERGVFCFYTDQKQTQTLAGRSDQEGHNQFYFFPVARLSA